MKGTPRTTRFRKGWVVFCICVLFVISCGERRQREFQFVAALSPDELKPLVPKAEVGLSNLGDGLFKVRSIEPEAGVHVKVVDGFLYERDVEIVHFKVELALLRDYEPISIMSVKDGIGEEGWSMNRTQKDYDFAVIFGNDWSTIKPKMQSKFGQELGAATAALFGDLGQKSAQGTTKKIGEHGNAWRVIVRLHFQGRDPLLFDVVPNKTGGSNHWVLAGGLGVFLWRSDLSKFSKEPYDPDGEEGEVLEKAKENFQRLVVDKTPGSVGARFREARLKYDQDRSGQSIAAGEVWTSKVTAVFDRGKSGSGLHHIGSFWSFDFSAIEENGQ